MGSKSKKFSNKVLHFNNQVRKQKVDFLMNSLFYNFAALIFYSLLFRSKLIPRIISIWGLIAVILLLIDRMSFELSGYTVGSISGLHVLGLHLGFNVIVLGIWLIINGFIQKIKTLPKVSESRTTTIKTF